MRLTLLTKKSTTCLMLAAGLVFSVLALTTILPETAQAASLKDCSLKVNKAQCEQEVKDECKSSDSAAFDRCVLGKAKKYSPVFKVCRDKVDPQGCHKKLAQACRGKAGTAREDCKKKNAKNLPKGASASGAFTFGNEPKTTGVCGEGENAVKTRFDFGCQGEGGPIEDLAYAIIRFLSVGVGLVMVASIIYAGIQYSSSEGNPEATQAAKKRIQNAIIGLIFYLFIFALVQYLVPGGLFS